MASCSSRKLVGLDVTSLRYTYKLFQFTHVICVDIDWHLWLGTTLSAFLYHYIGK